MQDLQGRDSSSPPSGMSWHQLQETGRQSRAPYGLNRFDSWPAQAGRTPCLPAQNQRATKGLDILYQKGMEFGGLLHPALQSMNAGNAADAVAAESSLSGTTGWGQNAHKVGQS